MDAEFVTDKLNIKTLLFTKAIPNYTLPGIGGHKVFSCIDCGDRYIMESSYNYHINRKSVKITYKCRHCSVVKIFFNRCNLLSHIRSHAFKTATINVCDLQVETLPIDFFSKTISSLATNKHFKVQLANSICYECKVDITNTGIPYKDRAKHYMQHTNTLHSCPICMFTLPTVCALKAHLRLHLKTPPFYCPECGINLLDNSIYYPYGHHCEGFKMMRATARLICSKKCSQIYHPNDFTQHVKTQHLKKIYKCPVCVVACFNESSIQNHLKSHSYDVKPILFYQCEKCSGKLVLQSQIDNHLKTHGTNFGFPCWICGNVFKEVSVLVSHHMENHLQDINITKQWYKSILYQKKKEFNVMKKNYANKNNLNSTSKKNKKNAQHNTSSKVNQLQGNKANDQQITCHLCKNKISQNWNVIKKHYANYHKCFKCLDIKVVLKKCGLECEQKKRKKIKNNTLIDKKKLYIRKHVKIGDECTSKGQSAVEKNEFVCPICNKNNKNMGLLEKHIISHRDPYMAYQCLECGKSFAVKPSFSTHLLLEHGISNVTDYILKKPCYNENALVKNLSSPEDKEPIKENQCRICRNQYDNSNDLQKHFRVHGMAFLLKNSYQLYS